MFLLGGPPFTGKTLLALLLNLGGVVCLDEPDLHNPAQAHRGIPLLRRLFPDRSFPQLPDRPLAHPEAVDLLGECERAISPRRLGMKTAEWTFMAYAPVYRERGHPVIVLIRDIRDVLAEAELPDWIGGEEGLNLRYRHIWRHLHQFDLVLRYEDLVASPADAMTRIARVLSCDLAVRTDWDASTVHPTMFKLERHELLKSGTIRTDRVGIWRTSDVRVSRATERTARLMGY